QPINNNDTKQKLISKAGEIFKRDGYGQTTVDRICEAVGISKNTYYYYFKSKEDLLLACIGEYGNVSSHRLADILLSGKNYFEQFWLVQKQAIDFIHDVGVDFFRELKSVNSVRNIFRFKNWQDDFEMKITIIRKAQEAGEVRNQADPKALVMTLGIIFFGIMSLWLSSKLEFGLEEILRSCLENVLDLRPDLRRGADLFELFIPLYIKVVDAQ
ncbi:MAG: TetR/AcrR family transcriptional regulator, partial [Candidatus Margulisbacteria bacterium]|nr:TetR/AcrR family transcriptional regulator [Candidatus Margulisiibacteriota bacterium]